MYPRSIPDMLFAEYTNGGDLIQYARRNENYYANPYKYHGLIFPPGMSMDSQNYVFYEDYAPLSGFGMYYVALFIIGNYARYYPDLWMRDIEHSSPLSLLVEELLIDAATALPLLTLSELSRVYYVPEGLPLH